MANPFDQFDEQEAPVANTSGSNPFDQFDEPIQSDDTLADTQMYSGARTGEEAFERYNAAQEDPRNANRIVPVPEYNWQKNIPLVGPAIWGEDEFKVGNDQMLIGAAANAAKSAAKTVTAVGGKIAEEAAGLFGYDYDNEATEYIDKTMPEMVPEGTYDETLNELATAAIGGFAGGAAAANTGRQVLQQSYQNIPKIARLAGVELGFGLGAAATMDEDTDTLLVGPDKIIEGVTPDGDYQDQLIAKKLNLLADGVLLGGAAVAGTRGAGMGLRFLNDNIVRPIVGVFKPSVAENQMFELMLKQTEGVENMNPEEMKAAVARISEIIQENRDVVLRSGGKEVDIELDPLAALERGFRDKGDLAAAARVKAQRDAIFKQGYGRTITKTSEYEQGTSDFADNMYEGGGRADGVEDSRRGVVESADQEISVYTAATGERQRLLDEAKTTIERTLQDDPTFGARLQTLGDETGINFRNATNETVDTIVEKVREAHTVMRQNRRELYDRIPEGIPIDTDRFADNLMDFKGTKAEAALPKTLRDILRGDEDAIYESIQDLDYKFLHNEILPNISSEINKLSRNYTLENKEAIDLLTGMKSHILKDQYAYVSQAARGNKELTDAVDAARQYEKIYQENFADGSPLGKIGDLNDRIVPGNVGDERVFRDRAGQTVEGAFSNQNRHTAQTFVEFLGRPEGGNSAPLVADYIIGKAARDLGDTVRSKGIDQVNFDQFAKGLRDEATVLYRDFPEQAARIDEFVLNLRNQQKSLPELEAQLTAASKQADEARRRIYDQELSKFFDKTGTPIADAQDIFNDIFSSNKSTNELTLLMRKANEADNPAIIRDGLQAAFGRYLEFDPTFVANNKDKLVGYAEIIFPDKPEVVEATRKAFQLIEDTSLGKAPENMVGRVPRQVLVQGQDAISRVLTAAFGVLNHTAAVIRGGINTVTKSIDPVERTTIMLGKMYTDPDEFFRLGQQYVDSIDDPETNQRAYDNLARWLTRGVNFGEGSDGPPLPDEANPFVEERPVERRLEPTGTKLPEAPRLPPVSSDAPTVSDPESSIDDLEDTEDRFPSDSFFPLEERDRQPLNNSQRTRFPEGVIATWEF